MRKHLSALLTAALFISSSFVPVMMISSTVHATDMKESNAIVLSDPSIETRSYASYSGLKDEVVTLDPVGIMTEEDPNTTPAPTPTVTPAPAPDTEKQIEAFITRFYVLCLNRQPDKQGLQNWKNKLIAGSQTGSDIAYGFVFSQEFMGRNFSNEEYVQILYEAFFDREADAKGLNNWVSYLNAGLSRYYVLHGFVESQEFSALCERFGINRGSLVLKSPSDLNPKITTFVVRFYRLCLGRDADPAGLDNWVSMLASNQAKGVDVAMGFVFSDEFVAKKVSNEDFVNILYLAFFNREPDNAGKMTWIKKLENGSTRRSVLAGFVNSDEFKRLAKTYGIEPGYLDPCDIYGDPSADLAAYCRFFIGVPYAYGSSDPAVGFDCSGFVKYIYQTKYDIELEHGSYYIYDDGVEVPFNDMQPGDILCYCDNSGYYYHVAIYIGDGRMVHASTRRNSIVEDPADGMGMPGTVRRLLPDGEW